MSRIIITGATGMIGIALIEEFLQRGDEVTAVIRPGSKRRDALGGFDNISIVECDITGYDKLPDLLGHEHYDEFYHLAWDGTYGAARNDMYAQTANIKGSLDALEAAAALGCKVFLGTGSQAEYGRLPEGVKVSPDLPCNPENGYGIAKLAAGEMTRIQAAKMGIKHVWVRIVSIYGPFDGEHTPIMSGIRAMMEGKRASFTKGEQMWDYIYVKDAAGEIISAAEKGRDGKVYIIGSGETRPLKEYFEIMRDKINSSLELGLGDIPYFDGQVMYLCADNKSLLEDTGYTPKYTFEEGIEETIEWVKKSKN